MNKNIFLKLSMLLVITTNAQTPIITAIVDGNCSGGVPKVIEIYALGSVDFSDYQIEKQTNQNTNWNVSVCDLSIFGDVHNSFIYIYNENHENKFTVEFPSALNKLKSSIVTVNGNDRIRIVKKSDNTVVDVYGADGVDGSGTEWDYQNGYAKRNNNTEASSNFIPSNWTFYKGGFVDKGVCNNGESFETAMGGIGTYENMTAKLGDCNLAKEKTIVMNTVVSDLLYVKNTCTLTIFDLHGKRIKTSLASTNSTIDLSGFPKGIYLIRGVIDGKEITQKIIKK